MNSQRTLEPLRSQRSASATHAAQAADPLFAELTALAAKICRTPVALLTFFEEHRDLVRASYRWNVPEFSRESSLVRRLLDRKGLLVITDASADSGLKSNPLVTSEPFIRFIAAAPLITPEGETIGALSVLDQAKRQPDLHQLDALEFLARDVMTHLDARQGIAALEARAAGAAELEARLRESEERFRELFDRADDLIMSIRPDGTFLHLNAAASQLVRGEGDRRTGSIYEILHPESVPQFRTVFDRVVSEGTTERIESTFVGESHRHIVVEGTLVPRIIDGRTLLARVIFRDITDRKYAEVELGKARDAALEAARLKSQFLTNVTHEVRTPMHGVVGMLGLLLETPLTGEQRDYVQTALASADSLLGMINNILHMSRLESGSLSSTAADFDPRTTAERVVEVMRVLAMEKDLTVALEIDPRIPPVLRGDVARVRQVLTNLLGNAIKFTERGSIMVNVTLDRETGSHLNVRFSVTDTGSGMSQEAASRLFAPFTQVDGSATRTQGGLGLGLATARQLVDLMGGAIHVETEPGKGSTFWFTVPFEKRAAENATSAASRLAFAGARALIIDQSPASRKLLEHHLGQWGIRTRPAASAAEALARLRSDASLGDPFRILIFDRYLAGIDGLSLAHQVRKDPAIADTALVIMTSLGAQVDHEVLRAAGVNAFVNKPVDRNELFDALSMVLARSFHSAPQRAPASSGPASLSAEVTAKTRILIAEDNRLNQKLTLSQLKKLGFEADVVANGAEVVAAVEKGDYGVVLMDCQMPIMDGYTATMEIRRKESPGKRTRIIAMTANALEGDREKCLAAGMDDYLSKPTRQDELAQTLAKWLSPAE